jgi:hypothetical protein
MRSFLAALALSMVLAICAVLAFAAVFGRPVHARDLDGRYANSELHDWYMRQRNQIGQVCCDEADWIPADAWGREADGRYWVEANGNRYVASRELMVNGIHPQGLAGVWVYPIGSETLRCLIPGMEG